VREVAGSNPVVPTISINTNGCQLLAAVLLLWQFVGKSLQAGQPAVLTS
jgi:hypothetical protein